MDYDFSDPSSISDYKWFDFSLLIWPSYRNFECLFNWHFENRWALHFWVLSRFKRWRCLPSFLNFL